MGSLCSTEEEQEQHHLRVEGRQNRKVGGALTDTDNQEYNRQDYIFDREFIYDRINDKALRIMEQEGFLNVVQYYDQQNLVFKPVQILENGSKYLGQWNENSGEIEGEGVLVKRDGSYCEGIWKRGRLSCLVGRYIDTRGNYYIGSWFRGKRDGHGIQISINHGEYKGSWRENKRHGVGYQKWITGNAYDGDWIDNKKHGYGVYIMYDGSLYKGEWENDRISGRGVYEDINGRKLYGRFYLELLDHLNVTGKCILFLPYRTIYEGQLVNWRRYGKGCLTYEDGTSYTGNFRNNMFHGKGTLKNSDGTTYIGEFEEGLYHGEGILMLEDGGTYGGNFREDKYHGHGVLMQSDGTTYTGEFKDDLKNGKGTCTWTNGDKHEGNYLNDKAEGKGEFTSKSTNTKYYGSWHLGQMDGFMMKVDGKGKAWSITMRMGEQIGKAKKASTKQFKKFVSEFQS